MRCNPLNQFEVVDICSSTPAFMDEWLHAEAAQKEKSQRIALQNISGISFQKYINASGFDARSAFQIHEIVTGE